MAVPTFMQGVQMSFLDTTTRARHKATLDAAKLDAKTQAATDVTAKTGDTKDEGFTFADALDIINPLQHLPIISTVYRSLTGDTIKPLERIAGDTLYGGVPGFMSSVANLAFEKITGKDFGDTAMAWLGFDEGSQTQIAAVDITPAKSLSTDKPVTVADNAALTQSQTVLSEPAIAQPVISQNVVIARQPASTVPAQTALMDSQSMAALTQSMLNNGIDSDLGLRAITAYQKMMADPKSATQPPAQLH